MAGCCEVAMRTELDNWHEIVIRDPDNLSAVSVDSFVRRIIDRFGIQWVRVSDIAGAVWGLIERNGDTMPIVEFLHSVDQASQYDWAFFFMYLVEPSSTTREDKQNMKSADITVRLVDDAFFFVYTTNGDMALQVLNWYPSATHTLVEFGNLRIPY
jgi:hypothetical protein